MGQEVPKDLYGSVGVVAKPPFPAHVDLPLPSCKERLSQIPWAKSVEVRVGYSTEWSISCPSRPLGICVRQVFNCSSGELSQVELSLQLARTSV